MADLGWHTKELNNIRSEMQRKRKSAQTGHGRKQTTADMSRLKQPSPPVQRLRKVRRMRPIHQADDSDGFVDVHSGDLTLARPDQPVIVKRARGSTMYFLMSLSLFGAAIFFMLGFFGEHVNVEHFVASEYLPAAVTARLNAPPKSRSKLQARIAPDETQQAAPAINQTNNEQPTRTTAENSKNGPDEEVVRTFRAGQRLMAAGDVRLARGLFATSLAYGMSEAALALGLSYDPNYLARIKNANAAPDAESARNWYAEWHRQSVDQDSIPSNVRLDRLLRTMNAN